jgi:hypothetical protein
VAIEGVVVERDLGVEHLQLALVVTISGLTSSIDMSLARNAA